jgi:hypothetical protein
MRLRIQRLKVATFVALGYLLVGFSGAAEAQTGPPPPKVSTFAPADDLARQADYYIKELGNSVADKADYKDNQEKLTKDANTLAVIALALGLNDQPNKYRDRAEALIKAAHAVAATKDFESAKQAVGGVRKAASGAKTAQGILTWAPVASLPQLMKQVPIIDTKLKRLVVGAKFKSRAKETAGYSAVIAAIGQASIADLSATKNPAQVKQWQAFAIALRDRAGAVNAAIHKQDRAAMKPAMTKLAESCEDCHKVFKPDTPATPAAAPAK